MGAFVQSLFFLVRYAIIDITDSVLYFIHFLTIEYDLNSLFLVMFKKRAGVFYRV